MIFAARQPAFPSFAARLSRRAVGLVALCLVGMLPLAALGEDGSQSGPVQAPTATDQLQIREGDQVWLLNTRGICCPGEDLGWTIGRLEAGYWQPADDDVFYKSDDKDTLTVLYVHGNRMDAAGAEARGQAIYRELFTNTEGSKVRFVIWSWPSEQIRGPVRDVRAKAARSDEEAYLLARFLAPIPADRHVGLIGFSYGARTIGGSLHLLAGGTFNGYTVAAGERPTFRAVFWGAAVQNDWLLPGNVQGDALPLGKRWLNIYNNCDSVLWRYDRLDRCDCSPALGYTGLAGKDTLPAELARRYEEWDFAGQISSVHKSEPYFYNAEIVRRTRETVLGINP